MLSTSRAHSLCFFFTKSGCLNVPRQFISANQNNMHFYCDLEYSDLVKPVEILYFQLFDEINDRALTSRQVYVFV